MVFSKQIDRAEAHINAAMARWYDISAFTSTTLPPFLRQLTETLAVYNFLRAVYPQDGGIRQQYLDDYKTALEDLKALQNGSLFLVNTSGSEIPRSTQNFFRTSTENYSSTIFDLDEAESWEVPSQRLEDIEANRD